MMILHLLLFAIFLTAWIRLEFTPDKDDARHWIPMVLINIAMLMLAMGQLTLILRLILLMQ